MRRKRDRDRVAEEGCKNSGRRIETERYYFANFEIAEHKKTEEICEVNDEPKQKTKY